MTVRPACLMRVDLRLENLYFIEKNVYIINVLFLPCSDQSQVIMDVDAILLLIASLKKN